MDNSAVDQIKQKLDILEVLSEYIRPVKAGRNHKARCPFHAEKTASLMISQEKQIWHCFGCGVGGDIFKFVMMMEGLEFPDALRLLAKRAGVTLKKQDPQVQSQKKRIYDICELTTKYYIAQFEKSADGLRAHRYLKERGMKDETIKKWRIGWAPDGWRGLFDFLKSRGYREAEIMAAGLAIQNENPKNDQQKYYDRFRSRIIFPIFDIQGQVIAFGGRIFGNNAPEDAAKYLNSPQTILYDKSRVLYGLNNSKTEIRKNDLCILVEGYMDLIMSWQAGVQNVVASSGTALTQDQLAIISRYTKNLAMAFDSDAAGEGATKRSIDLALKQDFNIRVIAMKDKDPADIIKKNPEEWKKAVVQAQSIMDFYFSSTFAKHNANTIEGKRDIKNILLPVIKAIPSRTEKTEWVRELALKLRADEKDLMYDMEKIKVDTGEPEKFEKAVPAQAKSRLEGLEERFLGLCLTNPERLQEIDSISEKDFEDDKLAQIFKEVKVLSAKNQGKDMMGGLKKKLSPELMVQVDYLSLKIQQYPSEELELIEEIETCLKELKVVKLRKQLTFLSFDIKNAQIEGNKAKLGDLLTKFSKLSSQLLELTKA